jgi:hypothetical protein
LWSHHHILSDGWSLPLLLKDVFTLYESHHRDLPLQLPPVRPFGDYIAWLEQREDNGQSEAFWREYLSGFTEPLRLGIDRGSAVPGWPALQEQQLQLSREETVDLEKLAQLHQLTVNTLVQSALAMVMGRYSGRTDVVFGVTVSGRSVPLDGVETMVGPFINTIPVRVSWDEYEDLASWLRRQELQAAELRRHEATSLIEIQRLSDIPRGTPLFEYLYVFENYPVDRELLQQQGSLRFDRLQTQEQSHYPLTFAAHLHQQLSISVAYDRNRFERQVIEPLLGHLRNVLIGYCKQIDGSLADLSL